MAITRGNLDIAMGQGAGGEIEHNGVAPRTRRRERNGVGAENRLAGAMGNHAGHAVDHRQGNQTLASEGLDVGPQGGEMMGVADGQYGDPREARFLDQQFARSGQRRLRKAIACIHADKSTGDVLDLWDRAAVDPAAVERRQIPWNPEHPMAVGCIALRCSAIGGQTDSHFTAGPMPLEDLLQQRDQGLERHVHRWRSCRIRVCRHCSAFLRDDSAPIYCRVTHRCQSGEQRNS